MSIYYVKPEWYEPGLAEVESPGGPLVKAYDKERTTEHLDVHDIPAR